MVSLQSVGQPGGGVTFFSDSLNSHHDDEPLLGSMPVLPREPSNGRWVAEEMKKFRSIRTPAAIVLAKVLYVCLGLAAYLIPAFCTDGKCGSQEATSLVTYVHGGMWFILLLVHLYLCHEHRNSLLHGYFSFHLETQTLKRASLFINTGANVVMLMVSQVLDAVCQDGKSCPLMSRVRYYQVLVSVEVVIALVMLLVYLVKTLRFNRAKQVPDFLRSSPSSQGARSQREIGFRAPFDLQTWALGQCWEEVYQLRQGCRNLLEEKRSLLQRVREHGSAIN
ncbi:transmembrane protein 192-like [Babylonia areolata]|uniref:transmembrane protein 192-like n=1 Tax=Babylonia areolata TaxID=304850 RepID=UPI003FD01754